MLQRLLAKSRSWGEALAGMDDPMGEYLINLEERVRRLESVVINLRTPLSADAADAVIIGRELASPSNQRCIA